MKKNYLTALLALAVTTTALVGCQGGNSGSPASKTDASEEAKEEKGGTSNAAANVSGDSKVHITWYIGDNGSGAHQALVDAFNASQDEIVVEWNVAPQKSDDNKQQLLTSLAAGSDEYDVIAMDCCWVADIASSGYLEPIDEYMMDSGMNVADFNPGAIQANTSNAKLYALPLYMDVASLCVRKDIVSEEDLNILVSGDYEYKDLMEMAAKYAGEGGTKYGLAIQANQYEGLICNTNEWTSNFTNLEEGLANFKETVTAGFSSDKQLSMVESDGVDLITSGQSVMYRGWSSTYGNFNDETAVGPEQVTAACLPKKGGATLGGWELGVNINCKEKDAAWKFIQYATSGEGNIVFCKTGNGVPGYTPHVDAPELLESHKLLPLEGFKNSLKIAISRPAVAKYNELSDSMQVAIHSYLSDKTSLEDAVAEVQSLLDEYGFTVQ